MGTDQRFKAAKALFSLVTSVEPRLLPLREWYDLIITKTQLWYKSEGNQGVKRMKDILHTGWLAVLGEDYEALSYVSSSAKLPDLVAPFVNRISSLRKDARLLSMAESFVRVTDLWKGQTSVSTVTQGLKTIDQVKLPRTAASVIKEFEEFLVELYNDKRYSDLPVVKAIWKRFQLSDKNLVRYANRSGPNGNLIENAHKDYYTIRNYKMADGSSFKDQIYKLQQEIIENSVDPTGWIAKDDYEGLDLSRFLPQSPDEDTFMYLVEPTTQPRLSRKEEKARHRINELRKRVESRFPSDTPGRLSFINEKSGKVRIVASPDYWTQLSMEPISDWLFNCLKVIESDCTFDQRSALPKICRWHSMGNTIYSFDQSSCTDLFPFSMQLSVLRKRFGKPLTEAVQTVMVQREWEYEIPKSKVKKHLKWSVGQPMGVIGSWPLMALTHHLLVQFASWRTYAASRKRSWKWFNDYVICGDDIVIASKQVADSYQKLVRLLGMKINMLKSHISGGSTGITQVSEFAKMTIWKGQVLQPVKPNAVLSAVRDWTQAVPLLCELGGNDYISSKLAKLKLWIRRYFTSHQRVLCYLLTIPQNLGGVGLSDDKPFLNKSTIKRIGAVRSEINPLLYYLCSKVRLALKRESNLMNSVQESFASSTLDAEVARRSPLYQYLLLLSKRRSERFKIFSGEVPTLSEIVRRALYDGWSGFEDYLMGLNSSSPISPWDSKVKQLMSKENSLIWARALQKPFILTLELPDMSGIEDPVEVLEADLTDISQFERVTSAEHQLKTVLDGALRVTAKEL